MGKNNGKVNIALFAAAVLLCMTLYTTHLVGGLYARYTTSAEGSDSARVAKFAFTVKDKMENELMNEFQSIPLLNPVQQSMSGSVSKNMLAPGSYGSFSLEVSTEGSETAVKLRTDITVPGSLAAVPLSFAVSDVELTTVNAYDLAGIEALETKLDTCTLAPGETKTLYVYWKWVDENTDAANKRDTEIGEYLSTQPPVYTMNIQIDGVQLN